MRIFFSNLAVLHVRIFERVGGRERHDPAGALARAVRERIDDPKFAADAERTEC